jgi:CheY-like chemotaxis protein
MPNGLLVDYHLDRGDGIEAVKALRERLGADLPAILITADRGARVRAEVRAAGIQLLYKPVKPAALRAMLSQWRMLRAAAAE